MRKGRLKRRFVLILALYTVLTLAVWLVYYNTVFSYTRQTAQETIETTKNNLLSDLSGEYSRLRSAATTLAGSIYVQDFLTETNSNIYYEKANMVSEIIRKTIYLQTGGDIIFTVTSQGVFHRFTGGISADAIASVYETARYRSAPEYSVVELDGVGYFCLTAPVFLRGSVSEGAVGHIVALSHLAEARRILTRRDIPTGIDTAIIADGVILFSNNPDLDGKPAAEVESLYGSVMMEQVSGSNLYAAAAITNDALYQGERLLLIASAITLAVLLATLAVLYGILSAKMVSPMIESADNMKMGLLKTQINAHFIANTITCIEGLAQTGETKKIAIAAANLAGMLRSQHEPGDEVNVFTQLEDVERYIEIMNIRSDNKFAVSMDVDDTLFHYRMPWLILQPLVENALIHGLKNKDGDRRLSITGKLEADCIFFEVSDNGRGIEPEPLRDLQEMLEAAGEWDYEESKLKGVALTNTQRRIRAQYGKAYGLTVRPVECGGLSVTARLPIIREVGDDYRA
ncbi:MAG: histidine kinase [Oscillospiraceae bacterium]|jgi:hypothetical protein|nr:histidine kinase [Oscillospiraceae bacterium]